MKIGPKYKIARRLGATVFEKTQTQKYAIRTENRARNIRGRRKAKSDYSLGLLEKQKARYSYGITSKQFSNYVKKATEKKGNSAEILIKLLESRLDNVVLRSGLASTRQASRQMVSHGHITVNGKKVTIPSFNVNIGDIIGIKESSRNKKIFSDIDESLKNIKNPSWLKLNFDKKEFTIDSTPFAQTTELLFSPGAVLEFYSR